MNQPRLTVSRIRNAARKSLTESEVDERNRRLIFGINISSILVVGIVMSILIARYSKQNQIGNGIHDMSDISISDSSPPPIFEASNTRHPVEPYMPEAAPVLTPLWSPASPAWTPTLWSHPEWASSRSYYEAPAMAPIIGDSDGSKDYN